VLGILSCGPEKQSTEGSQESVTGIVLVTSSIVSFQEKEVASIQQTTEQHPTERLQSISAPSLSSAPDRVHPMPCNLNAYVNDPDPTGLNIRAGPNSTYDILTTLPAISKVDGIMVHVIATYNRWMQIDHAESVEGLVLIDTPGWVYGPLLSVDLRAYAPGAKTKLYSKPDNSSTIISEIPGVVQMELWGCDKKGWIYSKWDGNAEESFWGWIEPADQCASPVTNCS